MIKVCYMRKGNAFCLEAKGHAGAAPRGEDLVCCGASTLIQTLAQRVLDLERMELAVDAEVMLDPEGTSISAKAVEGSVVLAGAFETILTGLRMMAHQWPQFVRLQI